MQIVKYSFLYSISKNRVYNIQNSCQTILKENYRK